MRKWGLDSKWKGSAFQTGDDRLSQNRFVAGYTAFCTNPDRRQRVQTFILLAVPFTKARTVRRLGRKTRFVRLLAWLTLLPTRRCFPHTSQEKAIVFSPGL